MPNRRDFLLNSLALAPCLVHSRLWAADVAKAALVIGNAAYTQARLLNPVNDAKSMHGLLEKAGFDVHLQLDAHRAAMLGAIERFGKRVLASDTKLAVFYYAGHGAQLEWRNFLVPVDAAVNSAAALKADCIGLGEILEYFVRAQRNGADKTFVVILDACRDNPFGAGFQLPNKGLSQFDAPVGSLLAYATGPGSVAADGAGNNGLYTEHLIKELFRQDVRIEDALKRVRLNVRLASNGEQIPWESTSLERDVFLFPRAATMLSEDQLDSQIEQEASYWSRIKLSRRAADWIDYLHKFPSGHFSEIAQVRLNKLLAAQERAPSPVAAIPDSLAAVNKAADLQEGKLDVPAEALLAVSHNPHSAGRFQLGRKFTVGDAYQLRHSDMLTGAVEKTFQLRVTRVDEANDRVEMNHGKVVLDLMGNIVENPDRAADVPEQFFPAELQIGKHWVSLSTTLIKTGNSSGKTKRIRMDVRILSREKIRVPAGEFNAFCIEASGWSVGDGKSIKIETKLWVVPGINMFVRRERTRRNGKGLIEAQRTELVAIRQAASGLAG